MLAKSNVGKLLPLILSLHTKQIKPLRLNLCIVLSLRKRVKRKGGFIYRCCFQNERSTVILPVNTSLGIRHLSIYLETGDKDCLTWEWIPTLFFFFASDYIRSLKWVWIYCYVTLLLRAVYFFFFFFWPTNLGSCCLHWPLNIKDQNALGFLPPSQMCLWDKTWWDSGLSSWSCLDVPCKYRAAHGFQQRGFCKHLHTDHSQIIMLI